MKSKKEKKKKKRKLGTVDSLETAGGGGRGRVLESPLVNNRIIIFFQKNIGLLGLIGICTRLSQNIKRHHFYVVFVYLVAQSVWCGASRVCLNGYISNSVYLDNAKMAIKSDSRDMGSIPWPYT